MPSKPDEFKSLMLPIYIYNRLKWEANKQNISLDKLLTNIFLLGFVSFDRDIYVKDQGHYKKVLFKEGEEEDG